MDIDSIVSKVIEKLNCKNQIPVEASGRHVHLSLEDFKRLFPNANGLTNKRELSQPGQYLCEERVRLVGPKGVFDNVAVLGPLRNKSQVELSKTDCIFLGTNAPVRESGDLQNSGKIQIWNKDKFILLEEGVIIAKSHIHMTEDDAFKYKLKNGETCKVKIKSQRSITLNEVVIRVSNDFQLSMHIDFDEANACCLSKGDECEILEINHL